MRGPNATNRAPTATLAASPKAGDAADDLGLACGLLRVVQFKCDRPEACFSVRVSILGSGPSQLGIKEKKCPGRGIAPQCGIDYFGRRVVLLSSVFFCEDNT
jgi:hypothetical protein